MKRISLRSRLCPRCGHPPDSHPWGFDKCPVSDEVLDALRRFRAREGRRWKSALLRHWQNACAGIDPQERPLLQQARNHIGPRGLYEVAL